MAQVRVQPEAGEFVRKKGGVLTVLAPVVLSGG
jgi:hypothetical protein